MKKILKISVLLTLLFVFFVPILILAQEKIPNCCKIGKTVTLDSTTYQAGQTVGAEAVCNLTGAAPNYSTKRWGLICLLSTMSVITDWIFTFLMVIVGIMVILGAFTLVTSAGDPEKLNKGKNYILYAAIGMVVALLAKAVPTFIESLLG